MMRRLPLVLLATVSAFTVAGCNFLNRSTPAPDAAAPGTEQPQADGSATPAPGGDLPPVPAAAPNFSEPVVSAVPNAPTVVAPDLIQSTNPNERAVGVQRSRPDPFATLPIPPTPPEPIIPEASNAPGGNQPARTAGTRAAGARPTASPTASANNGTAARNAARASASRTNTATASNRPSTPIAALPTVPQPNDARAVRISGVVQIGGTPYAIVQTPNEVERYVRAGDRIAGGRVLVKRIDTRSMEPRVVLEQNGIEVEMAVTDSAVAADAATPATPTSAPQPVSSLPNLPAPGI
jgi:hypothetical protein